MLKKELSVLKVDTTESFTVLLDEKATATGRTGNKVYINCNKIYDVFKINGSINTNKCEGLWLFSGVSHGSTESNGLFFNTNNTIINDLPIKFGEEQYLDRPYKVLNRLNETRVLKGNASIQLKGYYTTPNLYVSPIINAKTFSFIGIHNQIDWNDISTFNIEPNKDNRFYSEIDPMLGSSTYKYITKEILLNKPALDLHIIIDIHKPVYTDFDFYVKTRAPWRTEDFNVTEWVKIDNIWKNFICSEENEYREVEFTIADLMPNLFGVHDFNKFQVKLVGKSKNTATPILFKNLRIIAVT